MLVAVMPEFRPSVIKTFLTHNTRVAMRAHIKRTGVSQLIHLFIIATHGSFVRGSFDDSGCRDSFDIQSSLSDRILDGEMACE